MTRYEPFETVHWHANDGANRPSAEDTGKEDIS